MPTATPGFRRSSLNLRLALTGCRFGRLAFFQESGRRNDSHANLAATVLADLRVGNLRNLNPSSAHRRNSFLLRGVRTRRGVRIGWRLTVPSPRNGLDAETGSRALDPLWSCVWTLSSPRWTITPSLACIAETMLTLTAGSKASMGIPLQTADIFDDSQRPGRLLRGCQIIALSSILTYAISHPGFPCAE